MWEQIKGASEFIAVAGVAVFTGARIYRSEWRGVTGVFKNFGIAAPTAAGFLMGQQNPSGHYADWATLASLAVLVFAGIGWAMHFVGDVVDRTDRKNHG